jgi:lipid-binding SYLF domain-containing protein
VGAQLGGQSYSELIVFETTDALNRFKSGNFSFAANASAVANREGAARTAKYENGVAVFVHPNAGLMGEAAIGGQKFNFVSAENAPAPKDYTAHTD